jgi:hypothetical protein
MKLEPKANCPLDEFKPCRQLECAWFMKVRGSNPNTGEEIDDYGCAIAWMPILLIENSQQQRHTGAAVESFRNEVVRFNETAQHTPLAPTLGNAPINLKLRGY